MHAKSLQSCLTLHNPMDCSLPSSSAHSILPARILEWVAISFSTGSSQARIKPPPPAAPALKADSLPLSHQGSPRYKINLMMQFTVINDRTLDTFKVAKSIKSQTIILIPVMKQEQSFWALLMCQVWFKLLYIYWLTSDNSVSKQFYCAHLRVTSIHFQEIRCRWLRKHTIKCNAVGKHWKGKNKNHRESKHEYIR